MGSGFSGKSGEKILTDSLLVPWSHIRCHWVGVQQSSFEMWNPHCGVSTCFCWFKKYLSRCRLARFIRQTLWFRWAGGIGSVDRWCICTKIGRYSNYIYIYIDTRINLQNSHWMLGSRNCITFLLQRSYITPVFQSITSQCQSEIFGCQDIWFLRCGISLRCDVWWIQVGSSQQASDLARTQILVVCVTYSTSTMFCTSWFYPHLNRGERPGLLDSVYMN